MNITPELAAESGKQGEIRGGRSGHPGVHLRQLSTPLVFAVLGDVKGTGCTGSPGKELSLSHVNDSGEKIDGTTSDLHAIGKPPVPKRGAGVFIGFPGGETESALEIKLMTPLSEGPPVRDHRDIADTVVIHLEPGSVIGDIIPFNVFKRHKRDLNCQPVR